MSISRESINVLLQVISQVSVNPLQKDDKGNFIGDAIYPAISKARDELISELIEQKTEELPEGN